MAVTLIHDNGIKEYHRNPSGFNNKVNWLVSESKRDLVNLHELFNKVEKNVDNSSEWERAYMAALGVISCNCRDISNLTVLVKELTAVLKI